VLVNVGEAVVDECGECGGDGSSCQTSIINIEYTSYDVVGGFQFDLVNVSILGASGGAAEEAGFMISTSETTVLGFSLTGAVIPAGNGTLVDVEVDGGDACLANVIISDAIGNPLDVSIENCTSITIGTETILGCTDLDACNYNEDANSDDGSCEYPEENYDCDGNCVVDTDCFGECGGDAIVDECGECGGDGSSCQEQFEVSFGDVNEEDGTLEILLTNTLPVGGFQFEFTGINIDGVFGGSTIDNGFTLSNSSSTVLGFSLTGTTIPEGSGVLMNISGAFTDQTVCIDDVILSSSTGDAYETEVGPCWTSDEVLGCTEEYACNYNPDATLNDGSCFYAEDNGWCDCDGNIDADDDGIGGDGIGCELDNCDSCGGGYGGDQCCDTQWYDSGLNCAELEEMGWICCDCECPGDDDFESSFTNINGSCTEYYDFNNNGVNDWDEGPGCMLPDACNYNPDAGIGCMDWPSDPPSNSCCDFPHQCDDDTYSCQCPEDIFGCNINYACNYNPDVTNGDGSCIFADDGFNFDGECYLETDDGCECGQIKDCMGTCNGIAHEDTCGVCWGGGPSVRCWDGSYVCTHSDCLDGEPLNCDSALDITLNSSISGAITAPLITHYYRLTFSDYVDDLQISTCESEFDTQLALFNEGCSSQIAYNDSGSDASCDNQSHDVSYIQQSIEPGTYIIKVYGTNSWSQTQTGDYTLYVSSGMLGCTDSQACNYNPDAIQDNGSCNYGVNGYCGDEITGCRDVIACNYNPYASYYEGDQYSFDGEGCDYGDSYQFDHNGTVLSAVCIPGCQDESACNYNSAANMVMYDMLTGLPIEDEDESCYYAATCSDGSTDCSCNIFGCQDAAACNYNPEANQDSENCYYGHECSDGSFACNPNNCPEGGNVYGCTDDAACNYNPDATVNWNCAYEIECPNGTSACDIESCSDEVVEVCGDGVCDTNEDSISCPQDCGEESYCGDNICDDNETSSWCPHDCGSGGNSNICLDDLACNAGEPMSCVFPADNRDCCGGCAATIDCAGICGGNTTEEECAQNSIDECADCTIVCHSEDDDCEGDYYSIQDAIDNAEAGETILVEHGRYYENLIIEKSINLISRAAFDDLSTWMGYDDGYVVINNNIANTILDGSSDTNGENFQSVIFINSPPGSECITPLIKGFTITGGDGTIVEIPGGQGNITESRGGGFYVLSANPSFNYNAIISNGVVSNLASGGGGAAGLEDIAYLNDFEGYEWGYDCVSNNRGWFNMMANAWGGNNATYGNSFAANNFEDDINMSNSFFDVYDCADSDVPQSWVYVGGNLFVDFSYGVGDLCTISDDVWVSPNGNDANIGTSSGAIISKARSTV
jgi:hypothetical protein